MDATVRKPWGTIARAGLLAGILGSITVALYLYVTLFLPSHVSLLEWFRWIASVALGKTGALLPGATWIGAVVHALVSIGWAIGYAYLAASSAFINRRWVMSGLGFGVVVYIFMQLLLVGAGKFVAPSDGELVNGLIANCVFFGLPVAFVVARNFRA